MIPLPVFVTLTNTSGRKIHLRNDNIMRVEDAILETSGAKSTVHYYDGVEPQSLEVKETFEEYRKELKRALAESMAEAVAGVPEDAKRFDDAMEVIPNIYEHYQKRQHYKDTEEWFKIMDASMKRLAEVFKRPFVAQMREKESWEE